MACLSVCYICTSVICVSFFIPPPCVCLCLLLLIQRPRDSHRAGNIITPLLLPTLKGIVGWGCNIVTPPGLCSHLFTNQQQVVDFKSTRQTCKRGNSWLTLLSGMPRVAGGCNLFALQPENGFPLTLSIKRWHTVLATWKVRPVLGEKNTLA